MISNNHKMRDLNNEFQDEVQRQYSYNFDYMMHDWILEEFQSMLVGHDNCLELGCYKGNFTKLLSKIFKNIHSVEGSSDLYQELVNSFQNVPNIKIFNSLFEDFIPENSFENIFMIHVLEHLDNPQYVLKRVRTWLSEKGRFFIVVPNARALSRQIAVSARILEYNTSVSEGEFFHGHRRTYTLDTLINEARKSDFKVVNYGGIFVKGLANFQLDLAIKNNIIDNKYLQGCINLGKMYPDLCSSIYVVLENL
tara:strand:+ start:4064 stop:4819 length:756 start_codon:yes stop_codon:yes gene_type:complete